MEEASTSKEYGDFAKSLEDELMNSDTTEWSSSFDGSDCGDTLDDSEVSSNYRGAAESALDSGNLFAQRKKLSSHWRSFIHPLMWRCKWVELQIHKLEAQGRKYDKKLEGYNQEVFENSVRSEVLQRKKRRRNEETNDIPAYMSRHNLFSYYEHRRYIRDISHNVLKNPDTQTTRLREEVMTDHVELGDDKAGDCDEFLEDILRKIEVVQSRVHKMKHRVEELMVEEDLKLYSSPSPPTYRMPVGNYIASQLLSEYNLGAALLPTNGEVAPQENLPHFAFDDQNEDEDDVLIDNHRVREELRYFEEVKIHSNTRPLVLKEASGSTRHPHPQSQSRPTPNLTKTAWVLKDASASTRHPQPQSQSHPTSNLTKTPRVLKDASGSTSRPQPPTPNLTNSTRTKRRKTS